MNNEASTSIPRLAVIIVSFNTRELTLRCLAELHGELDRWGALSPENVAEVWLVDNDSKDGSAEAVRNEFPGLLLIENPINAGFGAANNLALARTKAEYILLLNSDAFMKAGAIPAMLQAANRHPEVAVVGPRLYFENGKPQTSYFPFPSPSRAWMENLGLAGLLSRLPFRRGGDGRVHDGEKVVDFVIGACMLVRGTAIAEVGLFDERFWMYAEETDWEKRMTRSGWKILFIPTAEAIHLGRASGAVMPEKIREQFFHSLDLYEVKHHGTLGLLSLRLAMIVGCSVRCLLWCILFVAFPRGRKHQTAAYKVKLCFWLLRRQLLRWPASLWKVH